jgi:isopenicillin N synthase-like dioxygenase
LHDENGIPLIDVSELILGSKGRHAVAAEMGRACRECGFFYIAGHGVDEALQRRLEALSRRFFSQDFKTRMEIRMSRGGRAWRVYFPLGGELTSGLPDQKEGLYFGAELPPDHPLVESGAPLHGPNLFPANIPQFRETVLDYMAAMTSLGHALMRGIALSLGLDESYFPDHYTGDPLTLFRIFNYPGNREADGWGVGKHTDSIRISTPRSSRSAARFLSARRPRRAVGPGERPRIPRRLRRVFAGKSRQGFSSIVARGLMNNLRFAHFYGGF